MNWNDSVNSNGYKGSSYSVGVAGHGSLSPYETSIRLLISGPSFKQGFTSTLPTANLDIAPTILKLHGLEIPQSMDGRPADEFYKSSRGADLGKAKKQVLKVSNTINETQYTLRLYRILYKDRAYIDYAETIRKKASK
jgi:arylsulfatase A-like enzyme